MPPARTSVAPRSSESSSSTNASIAAGRPPARPAAKRIMPFAQATAIKMLTPRSQEERKRGAFGGEDAVDLVLAHEACPPHVARRLLEELVHPEPEAEEVEALGRSLVDDGWHVGRAVERVLRSERFFSPRARRSRISGPIEMAVSSARVLGRHARGAVPALKTQARTA